MRATSPSKATASLATCTRSRWWAPTGRSTSCASRASIRRRSSPRCSTTTRAAASRSRRCWTTRSRSSSTCPTPTCCSRGSCPSEGVAELTDFMPVEEVGYVHNLVRRAKTVRGEINFRMVCDPRFDYGRAEHRVEQRPGEVIFESQGAGPHGAPARARPSPSASRTAPPSPSSRCAPGEKAPFVLELATPGEPSPSTAAGLRADGLQGHRRLLAPLDRPLAATTGAGARWSTARRWCSSC